MHRHAFRRAARLAALTSTGAACFASARAARLASAEAEPEPEAKKTCMSMTLIEESTTNVLACYAPEYPRVVADRVLIRPCMTEAREASPLKALAVVEDGSSQSILLAPTEPMWHGPPDAGSSGRVGYPVLPISIMEEEEEEQAAPPPSPSPSSEQQQSKSSPETSDGGSGGGAAQVPEPPTLWEQIEEPWRMLEAAGVLVVDRDESAMPVRVALPDGAVAWQGELPVGPGHASKSGGGNRVVTVRLITDDASSKLALRGKTAVPECGFCKFMKAGPCGELFIAWEACVDKVRTRHAWMRAPTLSARARHTSPAAARAASAPDNPLHVTTPFRAFPFHFLPSLCTAGSRWRLGLCRGVRQAHAGAQKVHRRAPRVLRYAGRAAIRRGRGRRRRRHERRPAPAATWQVIGASSFPHTASTQ